MKQYFVLTDSSDKSVYGIAIKEDGTYRAYGAHGRANEWASWINGQSVKSLDGHLPIDISISQPRALVSTDHNFIAGLLDSAISGGIKQMGAKSYIESYVTNAPSTTPTVRDYHLGAFPLDVRQRAVNFKTSAFSYDRKAQSFSALLRTGRAALDIKTGLIHSRIDGVDSNELQARLDASMPRIMQRRVGLETFAVKSASLEDEISVKRIGGKLGSRIGRGLRAAPSGMVFVDITGAIDADTDGIVFEGKPGLERPIIPRFTLPEALGRRISAAIQGDAEANEKLRRAGTFNEADSVAKLRNLLGSDSSRISEVDATSAIPRPKVPTDRSMARRAIMQNRGVRSSRSSSGDLVQLSPRQVQQMDESIRKAWNIQYRLNELLDSMNKPGNRDDVRLRQLYSQNERDYNDAIASLIKAAGGSEGLAAYRSLLADRSANDLNPRNARFHSEIQRIMDTDVAPPRSSRSSRTKPDREIRKARRAVDRAARVYNRENDFVANNIADGFTHSTYDQDKPISEFTKKDRFGSDIPFKEYEGTIKSGPFKGWDYEVREKWTENKDSRVYGVWASITSPNGTKYAIGSSGDWSGNNRKWAPFELYGIIEKPFGLRSRRIPPDTNPFTEAKDTIDWDSPDSAADDDSYMSWDASGGAVLGVYRTRENKFVAYQHDLLPESLDTGTAIYDDMVELGVTDNQADAIELLKQRETRLNTSARRLAEEIKRLDELDAQMAAGRRRLGPAGSRSGRGGPDRFDDPIYFMGAEEREFEEQALREIYDELGDSGEDVARDMFAGSSDYNNARNEWEAAGSGGNFESSEQYTDAFEQFTSDNADEIDRARASQLGRRARPLIDERNGLTFYSSSRSSRSYNGKTISGGVMPSWDDLQKMKVVPGPVGSNGGRWYEDSNTGRKFFVKPTPTADHAHNEAAVAAVYRAAGTPAPNIVTIQDPSGKEHVLSEGIPNLSITRNLTDSEREMVKLDMGIDMLLSNWDVYGGGENTKKAPGGAMYRLDTGGGGQFRARGGAKPSFNPTAEWVEPATMVYSQSGQSQNLYGRVTNSEFAVAMGKVANLNLDAVERELIDAGIPDSMRKNFIDTIRARQQIAKGYADTFSQYDRTARVNVSGTKIMPGGDRVAKKSGLPSWMSRRSSRSDLLAGDARKNPLFSSEAPEQALLAESFDNAPAAWGSIPVLPNTLSLLRQKRQEQFTNLVNSGISPTEAADLVTDAHVRSNMRLQAGKIPTSLNMAAYAEYADGYDSMLETLDGWPLQMGSTAEMKNLRQTRNRISAIDGLFQNISSSSARSVRWTGTSKTAPTVRKDIEGTVVLRGREGKAIQLEIVQDDKTGRFFISGRELLDDGEYRDIGTGVIDTEDDGLINGEFDSADQAIDAINDYIDGPYSYDEEYDDVISLARSSRARSGEILQMRSSVMNDDGNLERPSRGFHYADFERMTDKQLFEEYRNVALRSRSGDNVVDETGAAQRALQDRSMLSHALKFADGDSSVEFDDMGRLTGVPGTRPSLASARSGSADNFEINMTYRQLGSLQQDANRVRDMLDANPFRLNDEDIEPTREAMDEFIEAVETAGMAADSIIVSEKSMLRLHELAMSTQDRAMAKKLKGTSGEVASALNFAELIDRVVESDNKVFRSDLLDSLGTMHDLRRSDNKDKGLLGRLLDAARKRRTSAGRSLGPSYIESRSRRSNDARRFAIERDAFIESQEFDNYFQLFAKMVDSNAERDRRGIPRGRRITEQDYITSPEFTGDVRMWNAEKIRDAEAGWVDDALGTPSSRADLLSSSGMSSLSEVMDRRTSLFEVGSSRSRKEPSIEEILADENALEEYIKNYKGPFDTDYWTTSDFRDEMEKDLRANAGSSRSLRSSGLNLGSPSERRRIATLDQIQSARSARSDRNPGHTRLLDTDGAIWDSLSDADREIARDRMAQAEESLIEALQGTLIRPVFGENNEVLDVELEMTGENDRATFKPIDPNANEYVGLRGSTPVINLAGSATELERAPRDEKERKRQAKIKKVPYLDVVETVGADGTVTRRVGLNKDGFQYLRTSYAPVRRALVAQLEKLKDNEKEKRNKILREIALLDQRVTALLTISNARLKGVSGVNDEGNDPLALVPEQLPASIRKSVLMGAGTYSDFGRLKKRVFRGWSKGQAKAGTAKYRDLQDRFERGELDDAVFKWWRTATDKQLNEADLPKPDGFLDEQGSLLPDVDKGISLDPDIDIDQVHSAKQLGFDVPGVAPSRYEKGREGGFWTTRLFRLFRPNNLKWLNKQAEADAKRLQNLRKGQAGYGGEREDIDKTKKEMKILRKRKAERLKMLRNLRGKPRTAEEITQKHEAKREKLVSLVDISDDGEASLTARGIEALADASILGARKKTQLQDMTSADKETPEERKEREKIEKAIKSRNKKENQVLAGIWQFAGANERPTVVSDEEFLEQAKQPGAIIIRRGIGGKTFAEEYLDDDNRYTTGNAGELQGPGEYWAVRVDDGRDVRGQSEGWNHYVSQDRQGNKRGTEPGPGGIMAILPPTAKIITKAELGQLKADIAQAMKPFREALGDPTLPQELRNKISGDGAKQLLELLDDKLAKLAADDPRWATSAGQIVMKLINAAKTAPNEQERRRALKALAFLSGGLDGQLANLLAPIFGFDALRMDSGVMLVMNRGSLITFGGVGGLSMTNAVEKAVIDGTMLPESMLDKLLAGERVD